MKNVARLANSLANEIIEKIENNDPADLAKAILYGIIADRCRSKYLNLIDDFCNSEVPNE
jgi:hypothetical protein